MNIKKTTCEKLTFSYQPNELQDVLDYCNKNRYEIVDSSFVQDARSSQYVGESIIVAEKITD